MLSLDFGLEDIRYLFTPADYERGMQYARQGRVLSMETAADNEMVQVNARVLGTHIYQVFFQVEAWQVSARCSCPRFADKSRCKHAAAAMIAYAQELPYSGPPGTDRYGQQLLKSYMDRDSVPVKESTPAHLIPRLIPGYLLRREYPALAFRVGREKLYAVKNIRSFLEDVQQGRTVALGKNVTLDHSMGQFDDDSQKLIRILMNEFPEFRSMGRGFASGFGYQNYNSQKNEIVLTGDGFDRFFDLYLGQSLEVGKGTITLREGDPQVTLRLEKNENCARLKIDSEEYHFFGNSRSLYALGEASILRCSEAFRDKVCHGKALQGMLERYFK